MSDEQQYYVDPNSGGAPQPGGYAGPEAAEKGFATNGETQEETRPSEYQPPAPNAGAIPVPAEVEDNEQTETSRALSVPKVVLAELDEDGDSSEVLQKMADENDAVDNASVEHQGINPSLGGEDADADDEDGDDASEEEQSGPTDSQVSEEGDGSYDPSLYGVAEVNAYLEENPDEREAVVAAEREGKNRKGITGDE